MQADNKELDTIFMTSLREVIKNCREKGGKAIYKISAEASLPRSTWRDVEFGESDNILLTNFCRIAEGLNKCPWDLLKEVYEKSGKEFSFTDFEK